MDTTSGPGCTEFCFFCLRDSGKQFYSSVCKSHSSETSHVHEFSLRNLYRFLDSLQSDKQDKILNELKMRICEQCAKLIEEFNDLYNLLEETKLRLNWCIQKMEQVMCKAENEPRKVNEKLVLMLRKDVMDRIKAVTVFPRVCIKQTKRPRLSVSVNQNCETSSKMLKTESDVLPTLLGSEKDTIERDLRIITRAIDVQQTEPQRHSVAITHRANMPPGNAVMRKERHRRPANSKKSKAAPGYLSNFTRLLGLFPSSNKKVRCNLCKKTVDRSKAYTHWRSYHVNQASTSSRKCPYCPLLFGRRDSLIRHQVRFHPEHYFQAERKKAPGLIMLKQFQKILVDTLFPKFVTETEGRSCCSLCEIKYSCKKMSLNRVLLQRHLIYSHKAELNQTLENLLKDQTLILNDKNVGPTGTDKNAEKFTTAIEENKIKCGEVKTPSKKKVKTSVKACPSFLSNFNIESPSIVTCKLCSRTLVRRKAYTHWNYFCPNGLRRPIISKNSSKCPYCTFTSAGGIRGMSSSMGRHQVRFHPEQYFPEEREKMSRLNLNLKQFQRILVDFLFSEFIVKRNDDGFTSCSLCRKEYSGKFHVRVMIQKHLIFSHRMELKEKLKIILEDPIMLETRLRNLNLNKKNPVSENSDKQQNFPVPVCPAPEYAFSCPHCPYKWVAAQNGDIIRDSEFAHLVSDHPEHFLLNEEVPEKWRYEPIGKILTDIVFPKFVLTSGNNTSCSYCQMKCSTSAHLDNNIVMAKKHVLSTHRTELKEVVRIVLENPKLMEGLTEKVKKSKPFSGETTGMAVSEKGETSPDLTSNFCPVGPDKDKVHCKLCSRTLNGKNAFTIFTHWNYYCPKGLRRPINSKTRSDHPSNEQGEGESSSFKGPSLVTQNNSSKCPYCPFTCTSGTCFMGLHLVRSHIEHYFPEEKVYSLGSGLTLEQFQRILGDTLFPQYILKDADSLSCSLCGLKFKSGRCVYAEKHLISEHKTKLKERLNDILQGS